MIKLYTYSTEAAVLFSSRGDKISTYLMGKKYSGRKISSITSICWLYRTDLAAVVALGVVTTLVGVGAVRAGLVQLVAARTQTAETSQSVDALAGRWTEMSTLALVYVCHTTHTTANQSQNHNNTETNKIQLTFLFLVYFLSYVWLLFLLAGTSLTLIIMVMSLNEV